MTEEQLFELRNHANLLTLLSVEELRLLNDQNDPLFEKCDNPSSIVVRLWVILMKKFKGNMELAKTIHNQLSKELLMAYDF